MRYAYYMKADVDKVWDMECKTFIERLKHLEGVLGEDRYILQRQLDNHIKVSNKDTIKHWKDIYDEFRQPMDAISIYKISDVKLSKEELKEKHIKNLAKMGLKVGE